MKFTTRRGRHAGRPRVRAPPPRWPAINVVTTTEDLAALVREVGGDKVKVEATGRAATRIRTSSEPKPSFILKLHSADLLVAVGRELGDRLAAPADQRRAATRRSSRAPTATSTPR